MLHLNDYKFKSVIFVISYEHHLRFANENLVVEDSKSGKITNQMPCSRIFCVFVIGSTTITSKLLEKAAYHGFGLIFMKQNFKPYAVNGALTEGNTLLRKKQYLKMPDHKLAFWLVKNKIQNQLELLEQIRNKNELEKAATQRVSEILESLSLEDALENTILLGKEGNASKIFFKAYFQKTGWQGRKPRAKNNPVNTLLDIGYTFLFHFIEAHLRLYGFDVYVGFYHRLFYQRKSLVCDMVEPFRCIVDKSIRHGFNLKQFKTEDFKVVHNQHFLRRKKNKDYTRVFFKEILKHKEDIFIFIRDFYRGFVRGKEISQLPVFSPTGQENKEKNKDNQKSR